MEEPLREYRRNLPHMHPKGAPIFLTYRLAGSLPSSVLKSLKEERREMEAQLVQAPDDFARNKLKEKIKRLFFLKWDKALDSMDTGPDWLAHQAIAKLVSDAILFRHPKEYELVCFSIMKNHVHQLLINTPGTVPLFETIRNLKTFTAVRANQILGRKGLRFWQPESFDHVVRDGRFDSTVSYILNNPVAAGLIRDWRDWPHNWLNPEFKQAMI